MKVLFDNQKFTTDAYGGIVRYFAELMRRFDAGAAIGYDLPIRYSNTEYLQTLDRFRGRVQSFTRLKDFLPAIRMAGKARLYRLWCTYGVGRENRTIMKNALREGRFDMLHPTYYHPYFLKHLNGKPFVVPIHDMIHELHMAKRFSLNPTARHKKQLAGKAARIIAVSENTKRDIVAMLDIDPAKVDVVYHGNSLRPDPNGLQERPHDAPKRYMLFVGDRRLYKNFKLFIKAVAPLLLQKNDLSVACVGGPDFSAAEKKRLAEIGVLQQVVWRKASDQILAQYYSHAQAFVFPSLYEGFGTPVLEAFACGCPAIISNTSSLPEVGGDAAVYFDPHDATSIHDVVKSVLADPSRRREMTEKGMLQLQKFSWDAAARQTADVYQKALAA